MSPAAGRAAAETFRLEVRRIIARAPAEVFRAWTTPATMEQWVAQPGSRVSADVRVGGRFHIDMIYQGRTYAHDGEYLEVDPPRRLKFTWISEGTRGLTSVVTLDFLDRAGKTEVVLVHEGLPDANLRDQHADGWTNMLAQLDGVINPGQAPDALRVELRRTIARPVAEVWAAWTTPAVIAQWFSPGNPDVRVRARVEVGGRLRIELVHRGAPWHLDGEFLEVVPERRLKFTWVTTECPAPVGSVVTVDFAGRGAATEITLLHTGFPDRKTFGDHFGGWQEILGVFVAAGSSALTAEGLGRAAAELRRPSEPTPRPA